MKFAVCSEVFGTKPWGEVCALVKRAGFDGIEIASVTFAEKVTDISAAQRAEIRKTAQANGLALPAMHMLMSPPSLGMAITSADAAVRAKTVEYLKAVIDLAGDLGVATIVYGSPFSRNVAPGSDYRQAREWFVQEIRKAADHAATRKVTICIEPLPADCTDLCTTVESAYGLVLAANHPNFGLMLDCKAMTSEVRPVEKTISLFGRYAKHVHANDPNSRAPGFGGLDYKPIMKALKDAGYDGWVSLEPFKYEPDAETVTPVSLKYLKFCLA
jgi:sugar phosphate isomerase/epimerase